MSIDRGGDFNRTRLNGIEALATSGANGSDIAPHRRRALDGSYREFKFETDLLERNTDTLDPTLLKAKSATAATG